MKVKHPIPKTKELDNTLSLMGEGFDFLPGRRKELGSDIFEARLLGKKKSSAWLARKLQKSFTTTTSLSAAELPLCRLSRHCSVKAQCTGAMGKIIISKSACSYR